MGVYCSFSSLQILRESIISFIKENEAEVISEEHPVSKTEIKGEINLNKTKAHLSWAIENTGNTNSVRMIVKTDRKTQVQILITYLVFVIFLFSVPIVPRSIRGSDASAIAFIVCLLLALISGLKAKQIPLKFIKPLANVERKFKDHLRKTTDVKMTSPIDVEILPVFIHIVAFLAVCSGGLYLAHYIPSLFILCSILFLYVFSFIILSVLGKKDPVLIWKSILVISMSKWILFIFFVLLLVFVFYSLNLFFYQGYRTEILKVEIDPNVFKRLGDESSLGYISKNPIGVRKKIAELVALSEFEKIPKNKPDVSKEEFVKKYLLKISSAMSFLVLLFSVLSVFTFMRIFKVDKYWKVLLSMGLPSSFKFPSVPFVHKKNLFFFRIGFYISTLLISILNYAYAILSMDIIWYLITGRTLIVKKLYVIFSVVPSVLTLFGSSIGASPVPFIFLANLILFILAFPFLYFIFMWVSKFIRDAFDALFVSLAVREGDEKRTERIILVIRELCNEFRFKGSYKIRLIDSNEIPISARYRILRRKFEISLNRKFVDDLNDREIKAVFAHEFGHAIQDAKKLSLLKFLSRLFMFPNFFLTIILDYRRMENNADKFAIEITKDKRSLQNALLKTSLMNRPDEMKLETKKTKSFMPMIKKLKDRISDFNDFYFGDALIGYSHPTIKERLIELEKMSRC